MQFNRYHLPVKRGLPIHPSLVLACAFLIIFSSLQSGLAAASTDEDRQTLEMFFKEKDIASAATGVPQEVSSVAENLTIVTASEIEGINAHTVADVLRIVPGIQVDTQGGPGSVTEILLNGAKWNQFLVMIDGVRLNNLSDNVVNLGSMPVQNIKRIEIVKGPSSSTWGSALGGVINIVTKEPDQEKQASGQIYSSFGERGTADWRGELSGTVGSLGYYLNGSKLRSDGLLRRNGVDENNFYSKLRWNFPENGSLSFSLGYSDASINEGDFSFMNIEITPHYNTRDIFSSISLDYYLSDALEMQILGHYRSQVATITIGSDAFNGNSHGDEEAYGTSAKLIWREGGNTMVAGLEYDHGTAHAVLIDTSMTFSGRLDRWGLFINDTFQLGPLIFTPGFRYDRTNVKGDFLSASIGTTWQLTEHTLLRVYAGKGYSFPSIIVNEAKENVISFQAGFETSDIPFLLLKGTFFHDRSTDALLGISSTGNQDLVKEGFEAEVRTVPFLNTSLFAGYNYVDARNRESDEEVPGVARQTWNLGLSYDDRRSFKGNLTGHYIRWNSSLAQNLFPGRYGSFIWDINLIKKIFDAEDNSAELFFTGHNIFNGAQYRDGAYPNPRRWFEGGFRIRF